jgi:hypothetical protein
MAGNQPQKLEDTFLYGVGLIMISAMALFFVLVAWAVGGTHYKDVVAGNIGILLCVIGMAVGTLMMYLARKNRKT